MKYFISGGGTAGHIYPAIAIAEELKKQDNDAKIYYVGIKGLLEEEIAAREGYEFLEVKSKPLVLKPSVKAFKNAMEFFKGVSLAKKHIDKYKPDAVIATGGYVCGPIGYAAHRRHIPLFIHESNAHMGITTRFLDRYSEITFCPYERLIDKMKRKANKVYSGVPIRSKFKLENSKRSVIPTILSFGGSGGQRSMNEAVAEIFNGYKLLPYNWIHISGLDWEKEFKDSVDTVPEYATVYKYYHEFYELMAKADILIAGCGAQTLNEISAMKKPSILIPKSYVVENHQYYNAKEYEDAGAALMITEDTLNGETLKCAVDRLIKDVGGRKEMGERAYKFYEPASAKIIAENILKRLV